MKKVFPNDDCKVFEVFKLRSRVKGLSKDLTECDYFCSYASWNLKNVASLGYSAHELRIMFVSVALRQQILESHKNRRKRRSKEHSSWKSWEFGKPKMEKKSFLLSHAFTSTAAAARFLHGILLQNTKLENRKNSISNWFSFYLGSSSSSFPNFLYLTKTTFAWYHISHDNTAKPALSHLNSVQIRVRDRVESLNGIRKSCFCRRRGWICLICWRRRGRRSMQQILSGKIWQKI